VTDAAFRRAWRAATSTGPGYEPRPAGRFYRTDAVRGYYVDYRAKTVTPAENGVPTTAVALAQRALGWWERGLAGEDGAEASFLALAAELQRSAVAVDGELRWQYLTAVPKYGLTPPWCSAMAQGQAASVFVRAYRAGGDERFAEDALRAIASLVHESELVDVTPDGPVLEEAPSRPPSHILNGWIYALWGLWDVAVGLDDAAALRGFEAGVGCLRRRLDRYDLGWWTRYSLAADGLDVAKPYYHRLHVDQAAVLGRLAAAPDIAEASRRWAGYDRPVNVARALLSKAGEAARARSRE